MILEPDAGSNKVSVSVNTMLKAISASLLMEQVLAPNVDFKSKKAVPVGYVEGELPAAKVRDRFNSILQGMKDRGEKFKFDWFHILTKDDLAMHGFKYGFSPIAVSRNLSDKDAEDYGRKGRQFISNWIRDIEKRLGQPPFFFLESNR